MRVALYARVSKDEVSSRGQWQDPEQQFVPMRKVAEAFGWEVAGEFVDRASGGDSNRPQFLRMRAKIRQGHIQMVYVWSLDRFSREGIPNTMGYIKEMRKYACALRSHTETWLDTGQEGIADLLLSVMAWSAQQDRKKIKDNTRRALADKKAKGQKLGRPPKFCPHGAMHPELEQKRDKNGKVVELRCSECGWRQKRR